VDCHEAGVGCFDGSEDAAVAIRYAGELFPGRDALVLSVSALAKDEVSLDPISDLVGRFSGMYADWDEAFAELAGRQGRRGCELATEAGLLARPLAASGKPAPTILRTADEHDACAIVLGSGAHNRLGSPVGSVVARVVHGANRPVLVVPVAKQPRSEPAGA
jgi:nucleotide-binding universal stress UspA family protein